MVQDKFFLMFYNFLGSLLWFVVKNLVGSDSLLLLNVVGVIIDVVTAQLNLQPVQWLVSVSRYYTC